MTGENCYCHDDLYWAGAPRNTVACGADLGRLLRLKEHYGIDTAVSRLEQLVLAEFRTHFVTFKVPLYCASYSTLLYSTARMPLCLLYSTARMPLCSTLLYSEPPRSWCMAMRRSVDDCMATLSGASQLESPTVSSPQLPTSARLWKPVIVTCYRTAFRTLHNG